MELRTALYDAHVKAGGKMVPFAGYCLPVQYEPTGVIKEHLAVRNQAGLFDVSHMGEILCVTKRVALWMTSLFIREKTTTTLLL